MQTFCQYTIIKELGRGGMGTVYLAKSAKGESVALKVMGPHLLRDEAARSRFKREPKLAPSHPNIVRMLDASECNGSPFFVMEWIDGESLDTILRRQKTLPPAQLVGLLRGVADALDHVHGRSIIHRDIKPSNILVRKDGHVYLTDFGVAKNTLGATATYMSVTGARIGTAHYMSPEQAMGQRDLTPACDIYAMGVMAFHALSGRVPFDADSDVVVARMHMQDAPPDLRRVNSQVPQAVADVVMRALKKDPAKRFASAGAFVNALEQALNKPVEQPVIRRPLFWGVLAVLVALLSIGLVLALNDRSESRSPIVAVKTTSGTPKTKANLPSGTVANATAVSAATNTPLPAAMASPGVATQQPQAGATSTLAPTSTPEPTVTRARPTVVPSRPTSIPTAAATVYAAPTLALTVEQAQPTNPPNNPQPQPQPQPQPPSAPTAAPSVPTPAP